jgi:DNA relaxase NicK
MNHQKTTVDWFRFRTQAQPSEVLESLKPLYGSESNMLHMKLLDRGILGFQRAAQIVLGDIPVGRIDYGGDSQRGWVRADLTGKGCEWVKDWDAVSEVEALPSAQIRRLDIALTTWANEVTHEQVVQAHSDGLFITRGRPPVLQQVTSSDPRQGRTCYIGKREKADKFMRCYEKGLEIAGKYQPRVPGPITHIDGSKVEEIYRCEVELKAESSDIPWEVIERRDQYFAGAYPFCAQVLPNVEADILKRRPERECRLSLAAALENCRVQYGATLFTALAAYGGDMTAVWDRIIGDHHNQSLVEDGVLMVEHD